MKIDTKNISWITSKKFYTVVFGIVIPVLCQQLFTNIVNLLDTIMVGQLGTEQMVAVSVSNQIFVVLNVTLFGVTSGVGIFVSQFNGIGDNKGITYAFRSKLFFCTIYGILGLSILYFFGDQLILLFLNDKDIEETFKFSKSYLRIIMMGIPPFILKEIYSTVLKETGETLVPMKCSIVAVLTNLVLNYLLIFGNLGFPRLGILGAAIATVISRFIECLLVVLYTHSHSQKHTYIKGVYKSVYIPAYLIKNTITRGCPLMINELFYSIGNTVLYQSYSTRGLNAVASLSIVNAISMIFIVSFQSVGQSSGALVGPFLGAGKLDLAESLAKRLIKFDIIFTCCFSVILAITSPFIPLAYNTSASVQLVSTILLLIVAILLPFEGYAIISYFILRSGGKTVITFLFDGLFNWMVYIPLSFLLSRYTQLSLIPLYGICQSAVLFKDAIGFLLIKSGIWKQNLISKRN